MSSFECPDCKTAIVDTPHGCITQCEHYPFEKLTPKLPNKRTDILRVLAEYVREKNPVTKSVMREILNNRLKSNEI